MKLLPPVVVGLVGVLMANLAVAESDNGKAEQAKGLFEKYVALEQAFDPAAAELYSDDALIRNTRRYPNGQVRTLEMSIGQYKTLIRTTMPLARLRGDSNEYSNVTYTIEGERVRIKSTRYSKLKDYSSPLELLVGSASEGAWLIFEEISESRP